MQNFDGKNPGSYKALHIILATSVAAIPRALDLSVSTDITTTENFEQIDFVDNSQANYTESVQDTPHGSRYDQLITCQINKDRLALGQALYDYQNREVICLVVDHNDVVKIVGSKEEPCRLTFTANREGKLAGGTNLYNITISGAQSHPAYYYTGAYSSAI